MKISRSFVLLLCGIILSPYVMAQHNPERLLFRRTDNLPGADFTGALPTNIDREAPFGQLDDPASSLISALDVDREPGTEIDLLGDNYDLAFVFQFYDEDGVFSFTENFDDRVKVVATPIAGSGNLASTGAPFEHTDVGWNTRTFGNFDFSAEGGGGWFNVDIWLVEDGGGAQSAADIGFGYYNDFSTNTADFGGIGYVGAFGISSGAPAEFDADANGQSWGVYLDSFDPDVDTDGDSIPDGYEEQFFPGDLTQLGSGDFDEDGVNDAEEYIDGTDPTVADGDDDGANDGAEKAAGTDPLNPDTDGDGLLDGVETDTGTFVSVSDTGTDPLNTDTDGDNVSDGVEILQNTDPHDPDSRPESMVVQPSFVPINEFTPGGYGPDLTQTGLNYQENHYTAGVVFNNQAQGNYDAHVSGNPTPLRSFDAIVPWASHGAGGNAISQGNTPFLDGGGENFTVRINGYLDMSNFETGQYNIHLGADDTNYFIMDTADGQVLAQHNCCPQNQVTAFTISTPGMFPFDNVFGEQGGGEWYDVGISGPGINGIVALGDTANGSPTVYPIGTNVDDSDEDGLIDAWETLWDGIDDLTQLSGDGDFDNDGSTDLAEYTAGTDPTNDDTDADGILDGAEAIAGTDPANADTDGDGLNDGVEITEAGTDPTLADTDGDGLVDGQELDFGSDPLDAASLPVDPVVQPSFVPINLQASGIYGPDFATPGVDYQENKYNAGVIANGQSLNNYNVHVSGSPAPNSSVTAVQPWTSHGGGGNFSTRNSPFVAGGGDNFTVRYNGYLDMRDYEAGDYIIHIQSDDTNYFVMDTVDGTVIADDPSCCAERIQAFTISIPGLFPFDNVFGEQGGGEWTDVAISGPGIPGIVALGDTENGSPPVYVISLPAADDDGDGLPDAWEVSWAAINELTQLTADGDFDNDGFPDLEEYAAQTDPTNEDSDNDGLTDGVEVSAGTNPLDDDSDSDGLPDGAETGTGIFVDAGDTGTDPLDADTDNDGVSDGLEVSENTDPNDSSSNPSFEVIQPSFVPINEIAAGITYGPDLSQAGLNYQENHYTGGVVLNNQAEGNYDAHVSGNPSPLRSRTDIVPWASYGNGGGQISSRNAAWLDGGGDNFTVRINGYLDMSSFAPGTYNIHLGADDTNYFIMDTGDGQVVAQHNCCPQNQTTAFTITSAGFFPFDNVFGEQAGGDWFDVGISGPGINGIAALGDVENGSPPVYPIGLDSTDSDEDGLIDGWELLWPDIDDLSQLSGDGDFDNDGLSDLAEYTAGTNPAAEDTDNDGIVDGTEVTGGTDPANADTDGDGLSDGVETNTGTFIGGGDTGTDPLERDTDGDGLADGQEIAFRSNPLDENSVPVEPIIQPSFVPINPQPDGTVYGPDLETPGLDYQENKYNGGVILNGQGRNNYDVHVSGDPAPNSSVTTIVPYASHGGGGNFSTRNEPFVDNGGDNFTVRYNGYLDMRGYAPGDYTIHLQSDDTNYFVMDTADGTFVVEDPSCCGEVSALLAISIPGLFPFDNVFGEQGGGEWTDVAISGPGIPGIVALGDIENGSPPVYAIGTRMTDRYLFEVSSPDGGDNLDFTWNSFAGQEYSIVSSDDPVGNQSPSTWELVPGLEGISATPPVNVVSISRPADTTRLYKLVAGPIPPTFFDDFEAGQGGWTTFENDPERNTIWELGSPSGTTGPISGAGNSANAWSTNLGDFGPNSDITLRSPAIDLSGLPSARLTFEVYRDADGFSDAALVRFLRAADEVVLGVEVPLDMTVFDIDWVVTEIPVPLQAIGEEIFIEWNFSSDQSLDPYSGLSIDNVGIVAE
jgi:hypothetical protein